MALIRTQQTRRLVLSRETVRTLSVGRSSLVDTGAIGIDTSCGEACTCACDAKTAA